MGGIEKPLPKTGHAPILIVVGVTDSDYDPTMEEERTWVVKFRMSNPQAIPDVPVTGPGVYTEADVERMHERLRDRLDRLPDDPPRRLINAVLEDEALVGFLETKAEPSEVEYAALFRFTMAALLPYRRPKKFEFMKTYPPITAPKIDYLS